MRIFKNKGIIRAIVVLLLGAMILPLLLSVVVHAASLKLNVEADSNTRWWFEETVKDGVKTGVDISGDVIMWAPANKISNIFDGNYQDYIIIYLPSEGAGVGKFNVAWVEGTASWSTKPGVVKKVIKSIDIDNEGAAYYDGTSDLNYKQQFMNEAISWEITKRNKYMVYDSSTVEMLVNSTESGFDKSNMIQVEVINNKLKRAIATKDYYSVECLLRFLGNMVEFDTAINEFAGAADITNATATILYNDTFTGKPGLNIKAVYLDDADHSKGHAWEFWIDGFEDDPLTGLSELLQDVTDGKAVMDKYYTALPELAEGVDTLYTKVKEQADEVRQEQLQADLKDKMGQLDKYTAYEKWSLLAAKCFGSKSTGETIEGFVKDSTDANSKWKLSDLDTYPRGTVAESKDSLTDEEVLRLKATIKLIQNAMATNENYSNMSLPVYPVNNGLITISDSNTYLIEDIATKINSDFPIKYNTAGGMDNSDEYIIDNMEDLVMYLSAKVVGITVGDSMFVDDTNTVVSTTQISSYEALESLIPSVSGNNRTFSYNTPLARMKKIPAVAGTEEAYEAYQQLQLVLLIAENYARSAKSGLSDDVIHLNPVIDEFLSEVGKVGVDNVVIEGPIIRYIAEYTAITRALRYLGYEPFKEYTEDGQAVDSYLGRVMAYGNSLMAFSEFESVKEGYTANIDKEPLSGFFNTMSKELHESYLKGVALSATYIPLETNMYDTGSVGAIDDIDWVQDFHYPYGFYRKALYISTDVSSAVNWYVQSGTKGATRIATLKDLLESEKDVMLYIDDNFYNVDKLADIQGFAYTRLSNTEVSEEDRSELGFMPNIADKFAQWQDTAIENIVKTGPESVYSDTVKKYTATYSSGEEDSMWGGDSILSDDAIRMYIDEYDEYTPLQPYAVVSAIYRQSRIYDIVNEQSREQKPVFVSSPSLAAVEGIEREQWNSIYNYAMLKNLKAALGIDYKSTLDVDSPIYMDIYGNILTESGLVIIPAASNATLYNANQYNLYTLGFLSLYDKGGYKVPIDYHNSDLYMDEFFVENEETGTWELKDKVFRNVLMHFKDLPTSNAMVVDALYNETLDNVRNRSLTYKQHVYLITEVLRGAPIEDINKNKEGIEGNKSITKYGIYMAYKLDELTKSLLSSSNSNSLIALPNLAFMDGVEYVILFVYKGIFVGLFLLLFINMYKDSSRGRLGVKTILKFISNVMLFLVITFSIPKLMDISYYQFNKILLQEDVTLIEMLNLEKEVEGREIGVYEVTEPETTTKLYIKMDSLTIPWYEMLDDILFGSTFNTVSDAYEEVYSNSLMNNLPGVEQKGGKLYMDISKIFEQSNIDYNKDENMLQSTVVGTPYASYITPYYVILDYLTFKVNEYNYTNEIESYTTKIMGGGSVKTIGMIEPYLTSNDFMDITQDAIGMKAVYNIQTELVETIPFGADDVEKMTYSAWYAENLGEDELIENLEKLDVEAKRFVAENRDILGKVSDETFLEIMAMSLAVKHNDLMHIPNGDAVEIYDIDSRDIIRLSLAERDDVMISSSKSFARFVYDNGGVPGVVVVSILMLVCFVSAIVKPACIMLIVGCAVLALIFKRVVKDDKTSAIEGFIVTMVILCLVNILYAVLLKASMWIPNTGCSIMVSALIQILLQIGYMLLLGIVTSFVLRDSTNMGYNYYERVATAITSHVHVPFSGGFGNRRYAEASQYGRIEGYKTKRQVGSDILEDMFSRDERRNSSRGKK